jgi:transposase
MLTPPDDQEVLSVEDWAEIRRLRRAEGMPIKAIARVMGCSKNTVKSVLGSDGPPEYRRAPRGSVVDAVEPRIRELLGSWPDMPATVIAERIGWTRSVRVLRSRVAELRPVYLPPDPCSRTTYEPGEVGQCDFWFPDIEVPVGFGQTRTRDQAAGVGDGQRLLPLALGAADPLTVGGGSVRRLVATTGPARWGATDAGLGR